VKDGQVAIGSLALHMSTMTLNFCGGNPMDVLGGPGKSGGIKASRHSPQLKHPRPSALRDARLFLCRVVQGGMIRDFVRDDEIELRRESSVEQIKRDRLRERDAFSRCLF
jgi:hypothetical protein